jgi:hypothetical protein
MNDTLKFASSLLTDAAYLFIAGAIIFFYARQQYIRTIVQAISGKDSKDYAIVNRKVKKLGWTILIMLICYALFVLPMFIDNHISDFANSKQTNSMISTTKICITIAVGIIAVTIGGNTASWLVHDEDFKDKLNNK